MSALCRNWSCGCSVGVDGVYCDMCKEYTPICPVCCAVYGEHRLDCTVADDYEDCGEGPWASHDDAKAFAQAEVGVAWDVVCGNGKWYVVTKEDE